MALGRRRRTQEFRAAACVRQMAASKKKYEYNPFVNTEFE
jgi:hypothetical protein